jgi:hypothetical protein
VTGPLTGDAPLRLCLRMNRRMANQFGKDCLRRSQPNAITMPGSHRSRAVGALLLKRTPLVRCIARSTTMHRHAMMLPTTTTACRQTALLRAAQCEERRGDRQSEECQKQDGKKSLHCQRFHHTAQKSANRSRSKLPADQSLMQTDQPFSSDFHCFSF